MRTIWCKRYLASVCGRTSRFWPGNKKMLRLSYRARCQYNIRVKSNWASTTYTHCFKYKRDFSLRERDIGECVCQVFVRGTDGRVGGRPRVRKKRYGNSRLGRRRRRHRAGPGGFGRDWRGGRDGRRKARSDEDVWDSDQLTGIVWRPRRLGYAFLGRAAIAADMIVVWWTADR